MAQVERHEKAPAKPSGKFDGRNLRTKKRGYAMPGAGRPKGATTIRNREVVDRLMHDGKITPLETMFLNMRFYMDGAQAIEARLLQLLATIAPADLQRRNSKYKALIDLGAKMQEWRDKGQSCAVDAAPYCHARIASMTIKGDKNHPIPIEIVLGMKPREAADIYSSTLAQLPFIENDSKG